MSDTGRRREKPPHEDFGPTVIASPSSNADGILESSKITLTAGQKKLKERSHRLVRKDTSTSTPKMKNSGAGSTKAKNETPSSSVAKEEPIQKGKNYRTRATRKLKEKDPESQEVKQKKYVHDTKVGGRSKDGEFLVFSLLLKILPHIFFPLRLEGSKIFPSWIGAQMEA